MMELPVQSNAPELRKAEVIRALAKVVQANLVQLRVEAQRRGSGKELGDLKVASPGGVTEFREALIDRHIIHNYSNAEVQMRLREQWGIYCALNWLVRAEGTLHDFGGALPDADMHCLASVETKIAEVHAMMWRLRHELRLRQDGEFRDSAASRRDTILAARIPLVVQGQSPEKADEAELFAAACEHAGMLAALRWTVRPSRRWGDPELMNVAENPFDG